MHEIAIILYKELYETSFKILMMDKYTNLHIN